MDCRCFSWEKYCSIYFIFAFNVLTLSLPTVTEEILDKGHVSRIDRKYLTKGGYYQGAAHYWPFDYETRLRDVKYSWNGKVKGAGISISGKGRGFLRMDGNGWAKLGRFRNECLCDVRHCENKSLSVAFWVKLSSLDTKRKVLLGSNGALEKNTAGMVVFQSTRNKSRHISALVFMDGLKWKTRFQAEPENWFYLVVTWENGSGLRMYKNGRLMAKREYPKTKPWLKRGTISKCVIGLSPPSNGKPLVADYDDLVIWNYELKSSEMSRVFNNSFDPPKLKGCQTSDGVSLNVKIDDKDNSYEMKMNYKVSWTRSGEDHRQSNFTSDHTYHITDLRMSSEYVIEVQRRISNDLLSRSSSITCSTKLGVPQKPKSFVVTEKAPDHFLLQWLPPVKVYGTVRGYRISYKVDDFSDDGWKVEFRADVHKTFLNDLTPFTDYVIKLSCSNDAGSGSEMTIRATTAEDVPDPPRNLRVFRKGVSLIIKWKEPQEPRGLIDYKMIASVGGNETTVCTRCGEYYRMNDVDQKTTYTFWVIAYNINNDSRYVSKKSNNVTITTPSFTPSAPHSPVARVTSRGIYVSWKSSEVPNGVVEYKLIGRVNGRSKLFCSKCGLSYYLKNASRKSHYSFRVIAYNARKGYESPASAKLEINTASFVPSIPTAITVNVTSRGIRISWHRSHVLIGDIEYKLMGMVNGTRKVFCSKCGLEYFINDSEPNTNYSVWVIAYNTLNGYDSKPCPAVYFHTPVAELQTLEKLVAPDVEESSVVVSWQRPKRIDGHDKILGYKVTLYDNRKVLRTTLTRRLQLTFENLTQFSKYYVTAQVLTKAGYGPRSAPLVIQTKDKNECSINEGPCNIHAGCTNSNGSFFCACLPGYIGDGIKCKALPFETPKGEFCPEEKSRNILWKQTYRGQPDKQLCPEGTVGIAIRKCINGNKTGPYWANPNLSNCVSAWMGALDDKLADHSLNSTSVGKFFLNLLNKNVGKGLYGGDVIKSVDVIDTLHNKSKDNELNQEQSNSKSAETFVENVINITEKIISPNTMKAWKDIPKDRRTENGARITESLEDVVVQSAKIVNYSVIQNEYIDVWYGDLTSLETKDNKEGSQELNSIKFPTSPRRKRKDLADRVSVAVIKYKTIAEILPVENRRASGKDEFVNSAVLSVTMDPPLPVPFKKPFEFMLKHRKEGEKPKCAFFNTSRYPGFWSTNGCVVFNATANYTVCHCNHMTSFSVLMQVKNAGLSNSDELILGWITRIGLSISLIALGLAFLTFVCLPRPCGQRNGSRCFKLCEQGYRPTYLKKVRSSIHANLIFSLAVGEGLFLWGIEKTGDKVTCYTVAASLHYLFLVAFFWMAAEGVILYLVLVKVFQRKSSKKDKRMFMVICWGTPAAIVCITLAVGYENYLHEKCCWLSVTNGLVWSFVGPALTIIMVNVFFLCCTFRVMGKRSQRWDNKDINMISKIRYWAKGAAIVTCLLGITWLFGIFFINDDSVVVAYLFNICNVFQGLFIFVFHCLLDEKIRHQYYQVFCSAANADSRSPSHSTATVKKEKRRSTFNSWLWSVVPIKYQDSKSESCPTVAEHTLKRLAASTHSLSHSPYLDRKIQELKMEGQRPRGMSSIYHDSDENMDNIPDKIVTVKHSKTNSEENVECDEDTTGGMFPALGDYWISTVSRENSGEFLQLPETACEDCLYEIREWEESQGISRKTNSWHELQLRKRDEFDSHVSYLECQHETDDEGDDGSSGQESKNMSYVQDHEDNENDKCTYHRSSLPQIVLSDCSNKTAVNSPQYYQMVRVTDSSGTEVGPRRKLPLPVSV